MVTSVSSMFSADSEQDNLLNIVNKTLQSYSQNLNSGKIQIKSTQDLERIIRCLVILNNLSAANSAQDTSSNNSQGQGSVDFNDPDIKSLYDKIYSKLNQINNED